MDGDDFGFSVASLRDGDDMPKFTRFTIADAKQARLWGKDGPWQTYPKRMLMWRARGFNLRDNFGDVLKGLHTTEEARDMVDIGQEVEVSGGREPIVVESGQTATDALTSRLRADQAIKGKMFPGGPEEDVNAEPEDATPSGSDEVPPEGPDTPVEAGSSNVAQSEDPEPEPEPKPKKAGSKLKPGAPSIKGQYKGRAK
jgi:hypothetical protein